MRCTAAFRFSAAPRVHQSVHKSCAMLYCSCGRSISQSTAVKRPHRALPENEDWSKIRDPVERRKMQNRIAQRNYRKRRANINPHSPAKARVGKKIKQRLALLESRASSEGASSDRASSESGSRECFRHSEPQSTAVSSPHELCTADLHQSRDDYLQGRSFISSQQHADELLDALLPVVPSLPLTPSTSVLDAEAQALSSNRFLHT